MLLPHYGTVMLDWHDTLSRGLYWQQWRDDPARVETLIRLQTLLFADDTAFMHEAMRNTFTVEDACARLAPQVGVDPVELHAELRKSCEAMTVAPETLAAMAALGSYGVTVLIATDSTATFQRWTVPALGLRYYCDGILDSSRLGVLKAGIGPDGESLFFGPWVAAHPERAPFLLIDNLPQPGAQAAGIEVQPTSGPEQTLALLRELVAAERAARGLPDEPAVVWGGQRSRAAEYVVRRDPAR